jgi:hypothetical protein
LNVIGQLISLLARRLLGLGTIAAALYGLGCASSFVFPSAFRTDPDQFYSWTLRIMAGASFGLTLCLALSAVNLIIANRPRWTLLTVTYGAAWLYHAVVLILPELLLDSARLSFARAVGIANTGLTPLQMWHIPMVGTAFCGFAMYLSSKAPDAVRLSKEVDG